MKISLIICTRNRAPQLEKCLEAVGRAERFGGPVEIVIVDNGSTDHTASVIERFTKTSQSSVKNVFTARPGLGHARNCGIRASTGELLVFTDDDCYVEEAYFAKLAACIHPKMFQYGMGQILLYDQTDDERVANQKIDHFVLLKPQIPVLQTGRIQGANMFYMRKVFDIAGVFDEDLGAGTPFACEDIEMACRASHHGFTGALLPDFTVYHHHGRKRCSPEAKRTVDSYDHGSGAYYATLLARGQYHVWTYWQCTFHDQLKESKSHALSRLSKELRGAADYIDFLLQKETNGASGTLNRWDCDKPHRAQHNVLETMCSPADKPNLAPAKVRAIKLYNRLVFKLRSVVRLV
ncbi:glycosyltransferase family 2 protein [Noviherbaspirillum malthae]|uniref:glycosyltransferase family 2 protein n=1 Tax=Noviherbaspirillum malthae TaxID=1260987 RepID=UPI00188FE217|nr:glycosyltransferase family 2 protein [Noviherbaspirillum malthae]